MFARIYPKKEKNLEMNIGAFNLQEIKQADPGSLSYAGEISCSYKWTILDFMNRRSKKGSLTSEVFQIYEPDGRISNCRLMLYPRGDTRAKDGDLSLYLKSLK